MKLTLLPRSVLAIGLGSFAFAQAPAAARTVEDILPASTYATARFGGLQACTQAAAAVPMSVVVNAFLAKVPAETRAKYFDQGLDEASAHVQEFLQRLEASPADVRSVLQRPMVAALGRLTVEGLGPSVALVIDAGDSQPAIDRLVAAIEALVQQNDVAVESDQVAVAGTKVRRLRGTAGSPPIFLASVGGFFVATNSRGYLRDLGEVAQGKQPNLAAASGLGANRQRLPQPALASLFVNTRSVFSMFDAHLPYEAVDFGNALGLGRLDSLYFGTTASPQGGCDVAHVGMQGSADGLFKAMVGKPADLSFASMCSKNTVLFAAGSLDVPAVVDAFQRFASLLPAEVQAEMQGELMEDLGQELAQLGTSPEELDALLRAFGNQIGIAVGLEKGPVPKPELLLRIAVRDGAQIAPLLQQVEQMVAQEAGVEWKTRKVGDAEVRFCNVEVPGAKFQLSPCYVMHGKDLLFGSDVAGLVRALRQGEKPDESFAAQPDYQTMIADSQGASGILHLRLFRAAELGWRTVEQLAYPQLDEHKDEVGFGSDSLPDAETMAKALATSTFVFQVDAAGMTVRSHGTLGFGSLLAALGAAADEVLHRASGKIY